MPVARHPQIETNKHSDSLLAYSPPRVDIRPAAKTDPLTQSRGLTARDARVIDHLARHRVLTALQLARLVFGSYSHARSRLAVLHARGVLARFRREVWPGSQPWRYTLGPLGALIRAAATGAPLPRRASVTESVFRLAHSSHTDHRVAVNDFFATLAGHTYRQPLRSLDQWWAEAEISELCAGIVRPDAYGEYTDGDRRVAFFYEHDTGTETLETLLSKIARYTELADAGIQRPVLMHLPSTSRENHLHAAVARRWPTGPPVLVATLPADQLAPSGHHITAASPSVIDRLWLPVGDSRRWPLAELGHSRTRPS